MENAERSAARLREELLNMLGTSGTMAGLCIMGVTLVYTMPDDGALKTLADDLLAICALLFLVCTYLVYVALRSKSTPVAERLGRITDILFALGLTGMVIAGFAMVYTIW